MSSATSYLARAFSPRHHCAARRAFEDGTISFGLTNLKADDIALRAAAMFWPRDQADGGDPLPNGHRTGPAQTVVARLGSAPVSLEFDARTPGARTLTECLRNLAAESESSELCEVERGYRVLRAIAKEIAPSLKTGALRNTGMAEAAAWEIAVAIADPGNITFAERAAMDAVNGLENPHGCKLGTARQRGLNVVTTHPGEITLYQSADWTEYHMVGEPATRANGRHAGASLMDSVDAAEPGAQQAPGPGPRNVICQANSQILVVDGATSFKLQTSEWRFMRWLRPYRSQHATLVARNTFIHFTSPVRALHKALKYEERTVGHRLLNWLACVFRLLPGINLDRTGKQQYAALTLARPTRAAVEPVSRPQSAAPGPVRVSDQSWDEDIANCPIVDTREDERPGKRGRRIAWPAGWWRSHPYQVCLQLILDEMRPEQGNPGPRLSFGMPAHGPSYGRRPMQAELRAKAAASPYLPGTGLVPHNMSDDRLQTY